LWATGALFLTWSVSALVGPLPAARSQDSPPPAGVDNNHDQDGADVTRQALPAGADLAPEPAAALFFTEQRARSLLADARIAVESIRSIRMEIGTSLATWSDDGKPSDTSVYTGIGIMSRSPAPEAPLWQVRLRCEWQGREGNGPAHRAKAAYDGDVLRTYSDERGKDGKRVFEEILIGPGLMDMRRICGSCGAFNWAPPTIPPSYLNGSFLGEPDADTQVSHLGLAAAGTTICELVRAEWKEPGRTAGYPGDRYVLHFAIEPETKLPCESSLAWYVGDRLQTLQSFSVKSLELNPALSDADFTLHPPPGYESLRRDHRGPPVGASVGYWSLKDSTGKTHTREDYDNRVLVLDFWAAWCAPCRQVMPQIQSLHDRYKSDPRVAVLGVNCMEKGNADPAEIRTRMGLTYPTLVDGDDLARVLNVKALPTVAVIGRDRRILYAHVGYSDAIGDEVTRVIEEHLAGKGR